MKPLKQTRSLNRQVCAIVCLSFFIVLLSLAACTAQYYGYTKDQWQNMTPFEQEKAKVEWRQIIADKEKGVLGNSRTQISEGFVDYSENGNDSKE